MKISRDINELGVCGVTECIRRAETWVTPDGQYGGVSSGSFGCFHHSLPLFEGFYNIVFCITLNFWANYPLNSTTETNLRSNLRQPNFLLDLTINSRADYLRQI